MKKNNTYFEWWLNDLINAGIAKKFQKGKKMIEVSPGFPIFYDQFSKNDHFTKSTWVKKPIYADIDYSVYFYMKYVNKIFAVINESNHINTYDYKGPGNIYQNTLFYCYEKDVKDGLAKIDFNVNMHLSEAKYAMSLLANQQIFLNVFPNLNIGSKSLFGKTFYPERYRFTDGGTDFRKLKKDSIFISEYLKKKL